jgi:hypothetical protein
VTVAEVLPVVERHLTDVLGAVPAAVPAAAAAVPAGSVTGKE